MAIEPLFYQRCDAARATSVTLDPTVQNPEWLVYRVQTGSLHEVYTRFTASLYGVYIWNTPGTQTVHRISGRLQNQKLEFRS